MNAIFRINSSHLVRIRTREYYSTRMLAVPIETKCCRTDDFEIRSSSYERVRLFRPSEATAFSKIDDFQICRRTRDEGDERANERAAVLAVSKSLKHLPSLHRNDGENDDRSEARQDPFGEPKPRRIMGKFA